MSAGAEPIPFEAVELFIASQADRHTADMIRRAKRAGVPVEIVRSGGDRG